MATPDAPITRPLARALLRPLTVWGVERRLFFLALLMGGTLFNLFGSLLGGLATFTVLLLGARVVTSRDPQLLTLLLRASGDRRRYDPMKSSAGQSDRTRGTR